jgi:tetratricopeptide (TPR) repeat protein
MIKKRRSRNEKIIVKNFLLRLFALASLLTASVAHAQLIEDVDLRSDGNTTIVQVRFVTPVQLRRSAVSRTNDLTQAFYDVLPTRDELQFITGQRSISAGPGLPDVTITDESADRTNVARKLIIRFSKPTPAKVRAGRGNRLIEIVFEAAMPAVAVARPAPTAKPAPVAKTPVLPQVATTSGQRFIVTLQSSTDPDLKLDVPIPASLQDYQVFTTRRVIDGKTVYEVNLGYFETQKAAADARELLLKRFPQSAVAAVDAKTGVAATAPAATAPPGAVEPGLPALAEAAPVVPQSSSAEIDAQAADLLAKAKADYGQQNYGPVVDNINRLLALPPNPSSREGQELAGLVRVRLGDIAQARAEFDLFLKLYPSGADADRVRIELAKLPANVTSVRTKAAVAPTSTIVGSVSQYYYGGKSQVRTQEFQDSPISGLPQLQSDSTISGTDQEQAITNVDFNWRYRDSDTDMRFVFRDSFTANLMANARRKNKNRLSALYFDYRALQLGGSVRLGRQSPTGGGVLGRFDGVQAGYYFMPKWKVNVVGGVPTETLLDSKRHFYGASVDAEALTSHISGSLYGIQQVIDGEVDRRALGTELRYFSGGVSLSSLLDYDTTIKGLNIGSLQGTWQSEGNTTVNFLYDRRTTPMLMLGNALFFQSPTATVQATRLRDLLGVNTVEALREQVKATTTYTTQALLGATTPWNANWQLGGNLSLTNVGAIAPVADILPSGAPSTGNLWSAGFQLIGTNLYSVRDTHVFGLNALKGPLYHGELLSYNNSTQIAEFWLVEPSIKYYTQSDNAGVKISRWSPGLRLTYRATQQISLETELSSEFSTTKGPARNETANRVFYYLGGRYDF